MKIFINAISGGAVPINAPDAVFSGFITANIPAATAAAIVSYNMLSQKISSAMVPGNFPNVQLPTQIILPQAPPVNPLIRMTTFPSTRDHPGLCKHHPRYRCRRACFQRYHTSCIYVVAPPSTVLAGLIYTNPDLTYFTAAVARADSGQVNLNRFDSLLKFGVTNMTVLAPNDAAFQTLIYGVAYGYALSQGAPPALADAQAKAAVAMGPAIFSNPAFYAILPASSVRGIVAYHLLASKASGAYTPDIRVFSVNFQPSNPPGFVKPLLMPALMLTPASWFSRPLRAR
jgi:hypothetical protein